MVINPSAVLCTAAAVINLVISVMCVDKYCAAVAAAVVVPVLYLLFLFCLCVAALATFYLFFSVLAFSF